jgi:hypothetical protein
MHDAIRRREAASMSRPGHFRQPPASRSRIIRILHAAFPADGFPQSFTISLNRRSDMGKPPDSLAFHTNMRYT